MVAHSYHSRRRDDPHGMPADWQIGQRVRLSDSGIRRKVIAFRLLPNKDGASACGTVVGGSRSYPDTCVSVLWSHLREPQTVPTAFLEKMI